MIPHDTTTLMIRHFPTEVSKEEKIDFFTHFGAVDVRCLGFKNKKNNLIFARFETSAVASDILKRLHQTEVLGQRLSVEYIRNYEQIKNLPSEKSSGKQVKEDVTSAKRKHFEQFLQKLNSWTNSINFNQPPPVHLKYQYPPPTHQTLTNIVRALATVPKFYTQVLHLMNRMNLPCPFTQEYEVESSLVVIDENLKERLVEMADITQALGSSDESEMPSDGENEGTGVTQPVLVLKRRTPNVKKQVKRPKFMKPLPAPPPSQSKTPTAPKDVFETATKEPHQLQSGSRKIEVKLTQDLQSLQERRPETAELSAEGFEKIEPSRTEDKNEDKELEIVVGQPEEILDTIISAEELAANRISTRDQHILPVFKNYQPGIPSCRLYIKNLSKTVVDKDLYHIYRRYFLENHREEQGTMFDIRLMQEGRMKGQAFITLQTVGQAELALKETNGYILKGKPMVVQFARSSKTK